LSPNIFLNKLIETLWREPVRRRYSNNGLLSLTATL
jgi:hypothetical protein